MRKMLDTTWTLPSLNYMTPAEFAAQASRGKDAGSACLKNDNAVFHFPTATAAAS